MNKKSNKKVKIKRQTVGCDTTHRILSWRRTYTYLYAPTVGTESIATFRFSRKVSMLKAFRAVAFFGRKEWSWNLFFVTLVTGKSKLQPDFFW